VLSLLDPYLLGSVPEHVCPNMFANNMILAVLVDNEPLCAYEQAPAVPVRWSSIYTATPHPGHGIAPLCLPPPSGADD
jgi:hypothetical protein